jgi:hypothetical protein
MDEWQIIKSLVILEIYYGNFLVSIFISGVVRAQWSRFLNDHKGRTNLEYEILYSWATPTFIARTFLGFKKRFLLIYVARSSPHLRSWRNCVIQNLLSHITCECVKVSWVETNAMRINVAVKHYSLTLLLVHFYRLPS